MLMPKKSRGNHFRKEGVVRRASQPPRGHKIHLLLLDRRPDGLQHLLHRRVIVHVFSPWTERRIRACIFVCVLPLQVELIFDRVSCK